MFLHLSHSYLWQIVFVTMSVKREVLFSCLSVIQFKKSRLFLEQNRLNWTEKYVHQNSREDCCCIEENTEFLVSLEINGHPECSTSNKTMWWGFSSFWRREKKCVSNLSRIASKLVISPIFCFSGDRRQFGENLRRPEWRFKAHIYK